MQLWYSVLLVFFKLDFLVQASGFLPVSVSEVCQWFSSCVFWYQSYIRFSSLALSWISLYAMRNMISQQYEKTEAAFVPI